MFVIWKSSLKVLFGLFFSWPCIEKEKETATMSKQIKMIYYKLPW